MKPNTFKRKKFCKWLAAAGLFLCLLLTALPVHAEEETTAATQTQQETTAEKKEEAETKQEEDKTDGKQPEEMLPSGNLTLVDDVISAADGHREFLTVVSKDGSYFYIVIDREAQGAGNVYFLNLVDNQDLYKLTGEKATEVKEQETIVKPIQQQEQENGDPEQETKLSEEEVAKQKQKSLMITVGVGAAIAVAVILYLLKKKKTRKQTGTEYDLSDFEEDDE